ncbi:MAG: HAD family phosphatase [Phycisphaerae bacterium]|nr:HAD family phosphatase [Phycisphaerae bacterium]
MTSGSERPASTAAGVRRSGGRYDLVALDLDGTLLDPAGRVSRANLLAVERAREAGMRVVICTGRGLGECGHALDALGRDDPVIVSGGAMVSCPRTGATLFRFAMDGALVRDVAAEILGDGHAAVMLKDAHAAGYDYFVAAPDGEGSVDPASRWWFRSMGARVRVAASVAEDEHPEHTVRIGLTATGRAVDGLHGRLESSFASRAMIQRFAPLALPSDAAAHGLDAPVTVVELFDPRATKWSAVRWLADREGIVPARVVAVGDETNDLDMVRGAGLGIAMGNARPAVLAAAGRTTRSNTEDGVAYALERILEGSW